MNNFEKWVKENKGHSLNEYDNDNSTSTMQANRMTGAMGAYGTKRHTIETQGAPMQRMIQVAKTLQKSDMNAQQAMDEMMEMIPVAVSQAYKDVSSLPRGGYGLSQLKKFQQQSAEPTSKPQAAPGNNMPSA